MLSKKLYDYSTGDLNGLAPKETTTFTYASNGWKDQLVSINGEELTYDENGNLRTYGDKTFSWCHGTRLESITDGENEYSYVYDENGIRFSKTVNGTTTQFAYLGGRLMAQKTGEDVLFFQYGAGGVPLGFVLNGVQYFYITNQLGDIIGITDSTGKAIVEYTYDEWGNPIHTVTCDNIDEQKKIAEINPLRYRGYYYDTETGYYYLQSRYYNPEWGRFLSPDSFSYIDNSTQLGCNAYIYCANNPVMYIDPTGTSALGGALLGGALALSIGEIIVVILIIAIGIVTLGIGFLLLEPVINSLTQTKTLSDVKASQRNKNSKEYQLCYLNQSGKIVKYGGKLTFIQVLVALGVANPSIGISNRYQVNLGRLNNNANSLYHLPVPAWGVFADSQGAAKALSVVLGSNEPPQVHGKGAYAHYHDGKHRIHIWYGSKIY